LSFEKLLDPTGAKKKEFAKILDIVASAPRPKTDYRTLSHIDFLGLRFLRRAWEIQTSYMLLLRSFAAMCGLGWQPSQIADKDHPSLSETPDWSQDAGLKELYQTYCSYPHRGLIALFIDLKLEEPFFDDEYVARIADKPFTSEIILIDWGGLDREKELFAAIKGKSLCARKQSVDDIKSILGSIGELWREPGLEGISSDEILTPLPELPGAPYIEMLPAEREFWEGPVARAWRDGKMAFMREVVPTISGEKEAIPEKARRQQRNEWETMARQKKIVDNWAADIETALHDPIDAFDSVLAAEKQQLDALRCAQAYRVVQRRAGKRGVEFLNALQAGATILDASEQSGLPYRSAKRIVSVLRKSVPKD